jgi:GAF domain-containing protein
MTAPTKAQLQAELAKLRRRVTALERGAERAAAALRAGEAREGALARELRESLEQQAAAGEVLRVIASSPTDIQPVFDTILERAVRLCDGVFGATLRLEDGLLVPAAFYNFTPEAREEFERGYPTPPSAAGLVGRAVLDRAIVHSEDALSDPRTTMHRLAQVLGYRSFLAVPMLRDGVPIGVMGISRAQPQAFSAQQIQLVATFADQAVIAIENARLFKELQARNRDLTGALQRETATGEILRLINSSPTDVAPVFDGILRSAVRLAGADYGSALLLRGEFLHLAGAYGTTREWHDVAQRIYPLRVDASNPSGQAILERRAVFVGDAQSSPLGRVRDLAHRVINACSWFRCSARRRRWA